jgi:Big-like domain-containing protein
MMVGDRRMAGATVLLVALSLAACAGCDPAGGEVRDVAQQRMAQGMADAFQPSVTVNPPDGAAGVSPTERVTAVATSGLLTQVELRTSGGGKVDGALSPDGERWTSTESLRPETSYVLTAAVRAASGKETSSTSKFSTLAPGQQVTGKITPDDGSTLAAGRAVSVVFDKPIGDHAAAERALRVISDPPVTGTTTWRGDRELVWRPDSPWPAGGRVTAEMAIFGKELGPGLFGARDLRAAFRTVGAGQERTDSNAVRNTAGRAATPPPQPRAVAPTPRTRPHTARPPSTPVERSAPSTSADSEQPTREDDEDDNEPTRTKEESAPGLPILG